MFHLPETGLYLTHYRLYDPNAKRWLNRDPIGEAGGLNLYAYVEGNPVNFVDPTGETAWAPAIGVGIRVIGGRAAVGAIGTWVRSNFGKSGLIAACLLAGICNFSENNDEALSNERQSEYERAKNFCDIPPPQSDNECSNLSKAIDHAERCVSLYDQWDGKWLPGRHAIKIASWKQRIQNLKNTHRQRCTNKCP
jgi:type VI secretion system secreted protein VgrG